MPYKRECKKDCANNHIIYFIKKGERYGRFKRFDRKASGRSIFPENFIFSLSGFLWL